MKIQRKTILVKCLKNKNLQIIHYLIFLWELFELFNLEVTQVANRNILHTQQTNEADLW